MKCLIPLLMLLPLVSGCDMVESMVEPEMTPQDAERMVELEAENDALEGELATARADAMDAVKSADAEKVAASLATLQRLLAEQQGVSDEAQAILAASPTKLSGFTKLVNLLPPGPWQYLIPLMGTAATAILGSRSRKWAWITVKNSASVGLIDTLKNIGRTLGMAHSSEASHVAAVADPTSPLEA